MVVAREEIFGPVICIIEYQTIEQAIEIANDTPYGLAAAVYTKDKTLGFDVAKQNSKPTFPIIFSKELDIISRLSFSKLLRIAPPSAQ